MNQESELYLAAEARARAAADAPRIGRDPVAEARAAEDAAVAKLTAEVRGADPQLDAAIADLHKLEGLASSEAATIEKLRPVNPAGAATQAPGRRRGRAPARRPAPRRGDGARGRAGGDRLDAPPRARAQHRRGAQARRTRPAPHRGEGELLPGDGLRGDLPG